MLKIQFKLGPIAALIILCLIWAAETLRPDLFPRETAGIELSSLARESSILAFVSVLAALAASIHKSRWPGPGEWLNPILAGIGLFVLPLLLTQFAKTAIDDSTRVGLLSLTPLFAVVLQPYIGGDMAGPKGGFFAAMIAVAGTALLFPVEIPRTFASFLAFCAVLASAVSIAAANCLAVRTCRHAENSTACFAAVSSAAGSIFLGALAMTGLNSKFGTSTLDGWVAGELLALTMLFWLMPRMSAVRMTTRFLIAPLLANLAGLAILRPSVQLQSGIGLILIGVASGWLLLAPDEQSDSGRTVLGIR